MLCLCSIRVTLYANKTQFAKAVTFLFYLKISAADGYRLLCEGRRDHVPLIEACEYLFRSSKSGDFDMSDKECEGRTVQFEDAGLNQDSCQT